MILKKVKKIKKKVESCFRNLPKKAYIHGHNDNEQG